MIKGTNYVQVVQSLGSNPALQSDPSAALKKAFIEANDEVMEAKLDGGSACVCVYLHDGTIWVANAGDCRAVMAVKASVQSKMIAKDLSRDHKPDMREECERITRCGGFVEYPESSCDVARVCFNSHCGMPGLAMSR
jgi:serine/threonine protein phosphatase PrpC